MPRRLRLLAMTLFSSSRGAPLFAVAISANRGTPHPALSPCLGRGDLDGKHYFLYLGRGEIYDQCCLPCMGRGDLDGQHYFLSMWKENLDDQNCFLCIWRENLDVQCCSPYVGRGKMIGKRPIYRKIQKRSPIMQRNRQQNMMLFSLTPSRRAARQENIQLQDPRPHLWGRGRGEGVSHSLLTQGMNNNGGGI